MKHGLEIICDIGHFIALEDAWGHLLDCSNQKDLGYFNSWVWASTWWSVYAKSNDRLFIICQWHEGKLVGLGPFYIKHEYGKLLKTLYFIGTGEPEETEVATEYLDLLILDEWNAEFVRNVAKEIEALTTLSRLEFVNVLEESKSIIDVVNKLKSTFSLQKKLCGYRYVADLSCADARDTLSKSQAKKHSVASRRFLRTGEGNCFRVIHEQDLEYGMQVLEQLHQQRWQSKGKQGVFSAVEFHDFHRRISTYLLAKSDLLILMLKIKDKPIAIFYGWKFKNTLAYYQSGIDGTTKPNMSPGLLMHVEAMQWARGSNINNYDFMKGGETSYKSAYAEKTQKMHHFQLYKKSLYSLLCNGGAFLIHRIRMLIQ
ncbi:MAG: GNAT family N-acetyltransferase [Pseudomonadales bacterium]|nr:GNAT family N-acetyltransferase [Pseudomonadales bacterium]